MTTIPMRRFNMARVELENRLGVPLYRVLFTGTSYTVEPPPTVPPHAAVFWQTDDTGSATYSAVAGGNYSSEMLAETYSSAPTSPRDAARPVTLAWEFPTTGRPKYFTQNVAVGLRAEVRERFDGALYLVSQRNSKRAPIAPRRRRVLIGSSLLTGLLLTATIATAAANGLGGLTAIRDLFNQNTLPHPTTRAPQLYLAASQPNVPAGTTVTLTATANLAIPSGYEVDIFNSVNNQAINSTPCTTDCVASVTSASPTTITYQAFIEKGYQQHILSTSNSVTVVWVPPHTPTIRLTSSPAPDATGTVNVKVGATVILTATTDLAVDSVQYRIAFYDTNGNQVGRACGKGKSCSTSVTRASVGSTTYVAYADPTKPGDTRVPSSHIKVIWSASSSAHKTVTPAPPPPFSATVSLGASPAPHSSGSVQVVLGVSVMLTATARAAVDNTGYQIAIYNTSGNRVGSPCTTGKSCSAPVRSGSATTAVYIAHIERSSGSGLLATSNNITVAWSVPTITLSASNTNPAWAAPVTLTATLNGPVDGADGYSIQISLVGVEGNSVIQQCTSGSSCSAAVTGPVTGAGMNYQAFIVQGSSNPPVASSNLVGVSWPVAQITLTISDTNPPPDTQVTLTATADILVDNTGYIIQIIDRGDGNTQLGYCNTGNSCSVMISGPAQAETITYEAYIDQGNPYAPIADSGPVNINWPAPVIIY
jgi:hypothetical protein